MERLTDKFDDGKVGIINTLDHENLIDLFDIIENDISYASIQNAADRLAEYEDAGLEPSEITSLKEALDSLVDRNDKQGKTIRKLSKTVAEYQRLEEEGLLVRLPCKIGTYVWTISRNPIWNSDRMGAWKQNLPKKIVTQKAFEYSDRFEIGTKIFLAQAEAEETLKGIRIIDANPDMNNPLAILMLKAMVERGKEALREGSVSDGTMDS